MFRGIALVSTFSIFIPLLALLVWKKKFEGYSQVLLFIVVSCIFEMFFFITSKLGVRNIAFFHLYTLVEFGCLCYFFRTVLGERSAAILRFLSIAFAVYLVANPFLFEALDTYNSISRSLESILLTVFCLMYFYKIYVEETVMNLEDQPVFWIVTGLAIYLTVGLFSHLLAGFILKGSVDRDTLMTSYAFVQISNIIKNGLISLSAWKASR